MKKEESIKRVDETVSILKQSIEDIENWKPFFIDFDDNLDGLVPETENNKIIGVVETPNRYEALYKTDNYRFYTKNFPKKK